MTAIVVRPPSFRKPDTPPLLNRDARLSYRLRDELLLDNLLPGNRAFGYRRVIALIGIAPIPNRRCGCTGIRRIIIAVVRSRCQRSPEESKANTETYRGTNSPPAAAAMPATTPAMPVTAVP